MVSGRRDVFADHCRGAEAPRGNVLRLFAGVVGLEGRNDRPASKAVVPGAEG
jgi:hypothetical protein